MLNILQIKQFCTDVREVYCHVNFQTPKILRLFAESTVLIEFQILFAREATLLMIGYY
jgi:hypothetical protein